MRASFSMAACVVLAFAAALYRIRTFDTLFHLAAGRLIVEQGRVPATDPFSFTHRGASWLNHSYGYQVLLAELHELAGFAGLSFFQAVCAAALAAAGLFGLRASRWLVPAALLYALPFLAFREVLEARPHVLGFLALALTLQLVLRAARGGDVRVLFWIPPLYAAWAVVHGSHLLAFGVVAAGATTAFLQGPRAQPPDAEGSVRAFRLAWLAVLAAMLGLARWLAPSAFAQGGQHLASELLETTIAEWAPLRLSELLSFAPGYVYLLCLGLALVGALLSRRREASSAPLSGALPFVLLLAFCALSLTSRRMVALLLFGASPLWLPYAAFALERALEPLAKNLARSVRAAGVALAWFALFAALLVQPSPFVFGAGLDQRRFPVAATAKIAREARLSRIYNAYNFGGYLMFAGVPVFVDGRAITVYPAEFLASFERAYQDARMFEALAARHRVDGVLMPADSAKAARLVAHLRGSSGWRIAHEDAVAVLFERARPR